MFRPRLPLTSALFFLDRALGGRERLEAGVRDGSAALDREAVRAGGESRLGAIDGFQLRSQVGRLGRVELILVERLGVRVTRLVAVRLTELGDRLLDALALTREQLACAFGIHGRRLARLSLPSGA
jgi:hypothetical protein